MNKNCDSENFVSKFSTQIAFKEIVVKYSHPVAAEM